MRCLLLLQAWQEVNGRKWNGKTCWRQVLRCLMFQHQEFIGTGEQWMLLSRGVVWFLLEESNTDLPVGDVQEQIVTGTQTKWRWWYKEPPCQCRRCKRPRRSPWVRMIPWRRARQPTPVFLPGDSHGQRSLAGYCSEGHKESDTTETTEHTHEHLNKNMSAQWRAGLSNKRMNGKAQLFLGKDWWILKLPDSRVG